MTDKLKALIHLYQVACDEVDRAGNDTIIRDMEVVIKTPYPQLLILLLQNIQQGHACQDMISMIGDFGETGDTVFVNSLIPYLDSSDAGVRANAVKSIRQVRGVTASPKLRDMCQDEDTDVRFQVAHTLLEFGDDTGLQTMYDFLSHELIEVVLLAYRLLAFKFRKIEPLSEFNSIPQGRERNRYIRNELLKLQQQLQAK